MGKLCGGGPLIIREGVFLGGRIFLCTHIFFWPPGGKKRGGAPIFLPGGPILFFGGKKPLRVSPPFGETPPKFVGGVKNGSPEKTQFSLGIIKKVFWVHRWEEPPNWGKILEGFWGKNAWRVLILKNFKKREGEDV